MPKISKLEKIVKIKQGIAHVSEADGGFFYYPNDGRAHVRINKALFVELSSIAEIKQKETEDAS